MALLSLGMTMSMRSLALQSQPRVRMRAVPLRLCSSDRVSPCPSAGVEVPVGPVSDLRLTEESGRRVRLGWTGVPGATEYKVVVRNTQGEAAGRGAGGTWGTPARC